MNLPESITESPLHSAARSYIGRGWRVFPVHTVDDGRCTCEREDCERIAKHPLTPNGLKDASADAETIDRWWTEAPTANVAIRLGPESRGWALDLDGPAGLAALAELEAQHGPLPRTPTARTGGGGTHYFFAWPADRAIRTRARIQGRPIDTRGAGGYVVAPPSLHASGNRYVWVISPKQAPPAEAPAWLLDWVTWDAPRAEGRPLPPGDGSRRLRVVADEIGAAPGVGEGGRHAEALRLVGRAVARGLPADIIEDQALAWAARCNPPFPEQEILRIVRDLVAKHEANDEGRDQEAIADPEWTPPMQLDKFELSTFRTWALSDWIRDFVEAVAEARQTPSDLPALLALAVCGACCAREVIVRVNEGYAEPLNIYVVIGLGPANRKSAVFRDCCAPLSEYERQAVKAIAPQIAEVAARKAINEARLAKLQSEASKADPEDQEELVQQAVDLAREIAETMVPVPPRLLAQDATPEKIKSLLFEHSGRMSIMSAEGELFAEMGGRYGKASSPNIGVFLDAHCGDDIRVDRMGRPTEFVKHPALTVALTVQPDVIQGLAGKPGFRGQGLLGRFVWAVPESRVGRRVPNPPPVPGVVRETYGRNVGALRELCPGRASGEDYDPHELRLSPEAESLRLEFEGWLEPRLDPTGELGHVADWAGKLAGQVLRIAGLLHMADHAGEPAPWDEPIAGETMRRAVAIGRYLIPHALAAFGLMGADPVIADAQHILAWLRRTGRIAFTRRELFEATKGRFKTVNALELPLALLARHGYVRERPVDEHAGRGRKPGPTFEVNPLIRSQNSQNSEESSSGPPVEVPDPNSANIANSAKGSDGEGPAPTTPPSAEEVEYEEGTL